MSRVPCHVSRVTCHMSHVTCHMSCVTFYLFFLFFEKVVKLIGGGSVINGATPSSLDAFFLGGEGSEDDRDSSET